MKFVTIKEKITHNYRAADQFHAERDQEANASEKAQEISKDTQTTWIQQGTNSRQPPQNGDNAVAQVVTHQERRGLDGKTQED